MSELGKISGKLLSNNLLRDGVDLSFRNGFSDADILYLDVTNNRIGINTDSPVYDLDVNSHAISSNVDVLTQANIDNIVIDPAGVITTLVGPININVTGHDPVIFFQRMRSDDLDFNDNTISSFDNADIRLEPNSNGKIEIFSNATIHGDLHVKSVGENSVLIDGDLSSAGTVIVGDSPLDTVVISPDLTQDIVPGDDLQYDIGSVTKRWSEAHIPDWTNITTINPSNAFVSHQTFINGIDRQISTVQSNDNLILNPATGILYVEELKFEDFPPTAIPSENLAYTIDNPNAYGTGDGDQFGYAVDASTSYFIVGAFAEDDAGGTQSGKAYIYSTYTGSLLYTLDNPNPFGTSQDDRFGYSVGISESYAIVGASQEKGTGTSNEGKAYIYSTATGGLLHTLNNPNPSSNDYFGWSASISESYAIVGAYGESGFAGKAYIYDTATGTLLHTLSNPNADPTAGNDTFGISVSITDTHAIVGASSEDDGALSSTGKAYIFSTSTGSLLYTLDNPTPTANDLFGWSVSISDSYAAVGAYLDTINGFTYIYDLSTGSLLHSVVSPFNSGAFGAQFGYSVSITDDYTVVGAPGNGVVAQQSGRAYIYDTATGTLLHTLENPNAFNTSFNDKFGYSVAVSDTCIVIGAYFEDDALPGNIAGKAYVFGDISLNALNAITNLNTTTPVQFASTGAGYLRFVGTNGMVIPTGDNISRPSTPELGDTRWNTDLEILECFAGLIEQVGVTANVSGLPDQSLTISGTTLSGLGTGARFDVSIISGSITVSIENPGQGYKSGDQILILGSALTGGTSPTNDITLLVGPQTDDGYIIATGGGETVDVPFMEDLSNLYSLILG